MAKVVDAEKLIEVLQGLTYASSNYYSMPFSSDPNLQTALSIMHNAIIQVENNANQRINLILTSILYSIKANEIEYTKFDCLLCRPGNEGCIPGIDPNAFND